MSTTLPTSLPHRQLLSVNAAAPKQGLPFAPSPNRQRCPHCGRCSILNGLCQVCGNDSIKRTSVLSVPPPLPATQRTPTQPSALGVENTDSWVQTLPSREMEAVATTISVVAEPSSTHSALTGLVLCQEQMFTEKPDLDLCKVITKILWFLLLVASPFLILHAMLLKLGALPALIALAAFVYLLRFLSPMNLFALLNLSALLNPFKRSEAVLVPVRFYRIRGDDDSEFIVRLKGRLISGNLAQDDRVSFWGKWRRGTLFAQRAYSHRTRSWVDLDKSHSWVGLAATIVFILGVVIWFYEPTALLMSRINQLGGHP